MPFWQRIVIAAAVFVAVSILARLVDWRLKRRPLAPQAETRYLVLRRAITVTILVVGLFSALLVIPQVRALAGGLLASSAVLGLIVGFASQQVLGNFIAGLVIALTQPVRIGDRVSYAGTEGVVEEIGLTYTFINASIRDRETSAEVTVPLPLTSDVGAALDALRDEFAGERDADVYLDSLDGTANVVIRAVAADEVSADRLGRDLRLRAHRRLRELGVWGG